MKLTISPFLNSSPIVCISSTLHSSLFIVGEIGEALGLSNEEFYDKYGVQKPTKGDTNIVFHCRSGIRSLTALNVAYEMGYSK